MSDKKIDKLDQLLDQLDLNIDSAYKKEMYKGREKTTLEKLDIIKQSLTDGKIPKSLKILQKIINDMKKKKENQKLNRKKYDGL